MICIFLVTDNHSIFKSSLLLYMCLRNDIELYFSLYTNMRFSNFERKIQPHTFRIITYTCAFIYTILFCQFTFVCSNIILPSLLPHLIQIISSLSYFISPFSLSFNSVSIQQPEKYLKHLNKIISVTF